MSDDSEDNGEVFEPQYCSECGGELCGLCGCCHNQVCEVGQTEGEHEE